MFSLSNLNITSLILSPTSELLFGLALMTVGIVLIVLFKDKHNSHFKKSKRMAIEFRDKVIGSTHGFAISKKMSGIPYSEDQKSTKSRHTTSGFCWVYELWGKLALSIY